MSLAARRKAAKIIRAQNPDLHIVRFVFRDVAGDTEIRAVAETTNRPDTRQEIHLGYVGDVLAAI